MPCAYLVILLFSAGVALAALPGSWRPCKQGSPEYEGCLKEQITKAIRSLKKGNGKLGVLPLDPLRFERMLISQGSGPVSIELELRDVDFKGLSDVNITQVKNDWKKMTIIFNLDRFILEGSYSINGKVLVLPIMGSGKCSQVWEDMKFSFDIKFDEVEKDGTSYFQVSSMTVDVNPKKVIFEFDNLFGGNKALGDNMNKFLNENWEEIVADVKPAISTALSIGYREYINRILGKIPTREINP